MSYVHTALKRPALPDKCAVCDNKRTDAAAIASHNVQAASTGCRRYGK